LDRPAWLGRIINLTEEEGRSTEQWNRNVPGPHIFVVRDFVRGTSTSYWAQPSGRRFLVLDLAFGYLLCLTSLPLPLSPAQPSFHADFLSSSFNSQPFPLYHQNGNARTTRSHWRPTFFHEVSLSSTLIPPFLSRFWLLPSPPSRRVEPVHR